MNEFLSQLANEVSQGQAAAASSASAEPSSTLVLFANAILIGVFLMLLTIWVNLEIDRTGDGAPSEDGKAKKPDSDFMLTSANVLFMCIGMTAVMILVNNNLARAFAIGAAIALVRFRIKVEGKFLGMALFYGVLTGMACGVNRIDVAWSVAVTFAALKLLILFGRRQWRKRPSTPARRTPPPVEAERPPPLAVAVPVHRRLKVNWTTPLTRSRRSPTERSRAA